MENVFSNNVTSDFSKLKACVVGTSSVVGLSLLDIISFLVGQPVVTKLLWIAFTSKKAIDILNCNLALFHNLQYLISFVHLIALFLLPDVQGKIFKFLNTYAQIGGPMSLSFICMERYVAVIHPTSYHLLKKYRFREVCVVTTWIFSLFVASLSLVVEIFPSLGSKVLHNLPFSWLVAMTVMMVRCSISIMKTLKKSGPGKEKMHPVKRRAFKTVYATSAIVLIFYTPLISLQQIDFVDECTYDKIIRPICMLLSSAASVVHPLFYLSAQGKLFKCLK